MADPFASLKPTPEMWLRYPIRSWRLYQGSKRISADMKRIAADLTEVEARLKDIERKEELG